LVALAALVVVAGLAGVPAAGTDARGDNSFTQTNLVSNRDGIPAQIHDPALRNAWGLSASPTSPLWVSDNAADATTLYSKAVPGLKVSPGGVAAIAVEGGAPTGQVFNTGDFLAHNADRTVSAKAAFIFATENGTIAAWSPTVDLATAHKEVDNGANAVYKGLAIASSGGQTYLYAANFRSGRIEVYDSTYTPVALAGLFTDFQVPAAYAPFNIQELGGKLYVAYARRDDQLKDDEPGHGHGFVDVFSTDGHLIRRLVQHGDLNSPWGLALAPAGFGHFAGALLVGNFGNGRINAYNATNGTPLGALRGTDGSPIAIDGLWGLRFGNGTSFGTNELVFSAGPNDEVDGLLGTLTFTASTS
jgi:uncharacterized protein (TIGR03118 family)